MTDIQADFTEAQREFIADNRRALRDFIDAAKSGGSLTFTISVRDKIVTHIDQTQHRGYTTDGVAALTAYE